MNFKLIMVALLALAIPLPSLAEDIDLFVGTPPPDNEKPNVLIILDNTANWNTAFVNEKQALVDTFLGLDPDAFNVGLMMFGDNPAVGYVRAAIRPMSDTTVISGDTYTYAELYANMIMGFDVSTGTGDGANARTLARTFSEAYRYLKGAPSTEPSANGTGKNSRRDYTNNIVGTLASQRVYALPDNALSSSTNYTYTPPPALGVCAKTYVIYIGNTVPSGNVTKDNNSRNSDALTELVAAATAAGLSSAAASATITEGYAYTAHQGNYADEWARFMHDQEDVIFYAVDVDPTNHPTYDGGATGQVNGMGNSELLRSLSQGVGGGKYYRVNSSVGGGSEISDILGGIFTEIQAVNTVFASVALPASTTGQSVFLNQVFIGLFRPDANAYPRWPGNIKQYRLGKNTGTVRLVDAKDELAINPSTGFITECARSYWTYAAPDTYWSFAPQGICNPEAVTSVSNSPDGPYVEKGAQAFILRNGVPASRNIYTCDQPTNSCTARTNFASTNPAITAALLNESTAAERLSLISWAQGTDSGDENTNLNIGETRSSVHGDVIHSQPVALNYGTDAVPAVVVFYGGNDGLLRAVNGNQQDDAVTTDNISGFVPGAELWSFMPPEFWGKLKRLNVNTQTIKFPATGPSAGASGALKDYGMDGPITAYEGDVGVLTGQKYIYVGMRRGGRALYALNVTNPANPVLLWKRGCDSAQCSANFVANSWTDIGQTWSPANIAYTAGYANPVLIMGGGYDPCEDYDGGIGNATNSCDTSEPGDKGDKIYVIDAFNGNLLKVFDTERAVPGGVTLVPITDPNVATPNPDLAFAYATDTGGNVYRISGDDGSGGVAVIGSTAPSTWKITKIASFGCGANADDSCTASRKFLYGPDVVRDADNAAVFRILVGSGDREKPLLTYTGAAAIKNYFFSFVDKPLQADWLDDDGTCGADIICRGRLFEVTSITEDGVSIDPSLKGYAVELAATEQVVTGALVVSNVANFSTHIPYDPVNDPNADVCKNKLGTATTYNIDYSDASGKTVNIFTGGIVPTPVAGIVEVCEDDGSNCTDEPFCIGCGGENSPIGGGTPESASSFSQSKGRVYWNVAP
jgi:type IV pilus assembly protein PilY1